MRERDWNRFTQTPQGIGFLVNQQADQQRFGQAMAMDEARYSRARQDKLSDMTAEQRAAQAEKDREASALTAGYDMMLKDYASKGHLSPDHLAVFAAAKDPKQQAIMGKVLAGLAENNMSAAAEKAKQDAARQPWVVPVPQTTKQIYGAGNNAMGSIDTAPQAPEAPKTFKGGDGQTYQWTGRGWQPVGDKPSDKPSRAPVVREVRTPGGPGQPDQISYLEWNDAKQAWGPMTMAQGASAARQPSSFLSKFGANK